MFSASLQDPTQELNSDDKHGACSLFPPLMLLSLDLSSSFFEETDVSLLLSLFLSPSVGGLVKKILETKKDYESSPSSPKSKEQVL